MNRKNVNSTQIQTVALAAVAAASFVLSTPSAHAQQNSQTGGASAGGAAARTGRMNRNGSTMPQSGGVNGTASNATTGRGTATSAASNFRVTAGSIPGAVEPIMNRAATLLRVVEARQNTAPGGAKESYRASAQALRQLLRSNHSAPGLGSGTGLLSAPSVSSTQATDDIRTLRAAAKSSRGNQMAMLTQAAALYATGTKEYFTGQLREALFDGSVSAAPVVIRSNGSGNSQTGTRRRLPSNQQGGVTVNPPSVYNQPGSNNGGGLGDVGTTFGAPLGVSNPNPDPTVIVPGNGGVIGTVTIPPVVVSPTVPAPNQPVAPNQPAQPAAPTTPAPTTTPTNP